MLPSSEIYPVRAKCLSSVVRPSPTLLPRSDRPMTDPDASGLNGHSRLLRGLTWTASTTARLSAAAPQPGAADLGGDRLRHPDHRMPTGGAIRQPPTEAAPPPDAAQPSHRRSTGAAHDRPSGDVMLRRVPSSPRQRSHPSLCPFCSDPPRHLTPFAAGATLLERSSNELLVDLLPGGLLQSLLRALRLLTGPTESNRLPTSLRAGQLPAQMATRDAERQRAAGAFDDTASPPNEPSVPV